MPVVGQVIEVSVPGRITTRALQLTFSGNYTNQANGFDILDLAKITSNGFFDAAKQFSNRRALLMYPLIMSGAISLELIPIANQVLQWGVKVYNPGGAEVANATAYNTVVGNMGAGKNMTNPDVPFVVAFDMTTGT